MRFSKKLKIIISVSVILSLTMVYLNSSIETSTQLDVQIYINPGVIVAQKGNLLPLYTKVRGLTQGEEPLQIISKAAELKILEDTYRSKRTRKLHQNTIDNYINVHMWYEICGLTFDSLLKNPLFPHLPSARTTLNKMEIDVIEINLGMRIFGYMSLNDSGEYTFMLQTKYANAQVWFSESMDHKDSELLCEINNLQNNGVHVVSKAMQLSVGKYFFDIVVKTGNRYKGSFVLKWMTPQRQTAHSIDSTIFSPVFNDIFYRSNEVILDYDIPRNLPMLYTRKKLSELYFDEVNFRRSKMYLLPFVPEEDIVDLFTECDYFPSYIIHKKLAKDQGVWETHYTSIYPGDHTNVSYRLLTNIDQVIFGNDILGKEIADDVVSKTMDALKTKHKDKYTLQHVLNVELNEDVEKGRRFLVELQLFDTVSEKSMRFSEYVYQPIVYNELCYPKDFKWNKTAVVNVILTVGNQGRWAKHFINTMSRIYDDTKDERLNIIMVDFDSKDIDIVRALEESSLPKYTLIKRKGLFHKTEAIQAAANTVLDSGGIVMQVDLHMTVPSDFIDHVRKHTVQGKMACSPLLLRLQCGAYPQNLYGFWEISGYGIFGVYKSDWDVFGGMDVKNFRNQWGGEDWDLLDRVLMAGYEVERLKVPHLNHVFHTKKGMWNSEV